MESPGSIVIAGASLAGGRAAETLRAEGFDGTLVLLGAEPHRPYERPPLSKQVLRGDWAPDRAFLHDESFYRDNDIELRLGVRATAVDARDRIVETDGGERIGFDRLLIATGGAPRALPIPGADLEGVHVLRTIEDSAALGAALGPDVPIVIVGAGLIGCEVAASATQAGCRVTMIDMIAAPMERILGPSIGAAVGEKHRSEGVRFLGGTGVSAIEGDAGRAVRVVASDGSSHEAAAVVVAVGILPEIALAQSAGAETGNGIEVNERCETSVPGIFAAGDVARHPNPYLGERIRVEHWQNAQNQGVAAARSMLGKGEPYAEVPWFWTDQYDWNIQMAGHPALDDDIVVRGDLASGSFSAFYLRGGIVRAVLGVNRPRDVRASRAMIRTGAAPKPDALADESTDLKALAAG